MDNHLPVTAPAGDAAPAHLRDLFDPCDLGPIERMPFTAPSLARSFTGRTLDLDILQHSLAGERRRFGYRRLLFLLRREGLTLNHKKLFRLYHEERLSVRRRGGRKRTLGTRAPAAVPQEPNRRWSLDFVSDTLDDGHRFRILVVVDDCTRECQEHCPERSFPAFGKDDAAQ